MGCLPSMCRLGSVVQRGSKKTWVRFVSLLDGLLAAPLQILVSEFVPSTTSTIILARSLSLVPMSNTIGQLDMFIWELCLTL
jgi:hypothetical protein